MTITVQRDKSLPMRQVIQIGQHQLMADSTVEEGGSDAGPSPHDLYDAALAACKALTVLWYARRKGIALDDCHVTMERDASAERSGTYRLRASLHLVGDLSDEQRQLLLAGAAKCPVHKLMTSVTTEIETVLA